MKIKYREIKSDSIHNLYILMVLCLLISSLNSCCSYVGCLGADQMDGIYLKNFLTTDVDSIIISSYEKGTDFMLLTDSFMVEQCDSFGNGSFYMLFNFKTISIENDYKIYFTKASKIYKISRFKTSEAECKSCYNFTRLDGYEINGKFKSLGYIEIDKHTD